MRSTAAGAVGAGANGSSAVQRALGVLAGVGGAGDLHVPREGLVQAMVDGPQLLGNRAGGQDAGHFGQTLIGRQKRRIIGRSHWDPQMELPNSDLRLATGSPSGVTESSRDSIC